MVLALGGAVAGLIAGGVARFWGRYLLDTPYQGYLEPEKMIRVPAGMSAGAVSRLLENNGIIISGRVFQYRLAWKGMESRIQSGFYAFSKPMSMEAVAAALVQGDTASRQVTIPEGWTSSLAFHRLEDAGLGRYSEYLREWRKVSLISDLDPAAASLEGYLFPDTYSFPPDAGPGQVVRVMLRRFRQVALPMLRNTRPPGGLDPHALVTLASLVEKEAGGVAEQPLVASVFYNRLAKGMKLQCDPTVIYAEWLRKGFWDGEINRSDLTAESPYNTYIRSGLPPGPICNPGRSAIQAVLMPARTGHLYFVAAHDGTHVFSSDLATHNRAVRKYQR